METYYKIIKKRTIEGQTKLLSFCCDVLPQEMVQEYKVGQFVSSNIKGSDLLIFDEYQNAKAFLRQEDRWDFITTRPSPTDKLHIYECEAKDVSNVGFLSMPWYTDIYKRLLKYLEEAKDYEKWNKSFNRDIKLNRQEKFVWGTLFAKEVKLIKEVDYL